MKMKVAIYYKKKFFSERWVEYCDNNNIPFKLVNPYDSNIVEQLSDCTAFMWHHHHANYMDVLFAKQLLYSLQLKGLNVFPNFNTTWFFDDKVGQKYLLESIGLPFIPSYVFYKKEDALTWINITSFPKVFKLRGGAGSSNVKLVNNKNEAKNLVNRAFGKGFSQYDSLQNLKERYRKYKLGKSPFTSVLKGLIRILIPTEYSKMKLNEKGYVYFQDFIPNNKFDIRVCVIGDFAFAIKRMCRKNDFRASGSGELIYDKNQIDIKFIEQAFLLNMKLKSQTLAVDFVLSECNQPLIVEISYGFVPAGYDKCEGYWDKNLIWYPGFFNPYGWMVDNLINDI
jgi:glutathione synthase/RimK-type ligase-like ATP-grasp enzyme